MIDINFHHLILERLDKISALLKNDPASVADRMVHGRFERIKCSYGTAASSALPTIPIEVPGLDPGYSNPEAKIEDSRMIITTEEIRSLFNAQVNRMLDVIDEQMDRVQKDHPGTRIVGSLIKLGPHYADRILVVYSPIRRSRKLSIREAVLEVSL